MTGKDRKIKNKEDLRQEILNTAKAVFTLYGYEATSIRKIASEIGFSPTAIYIYYKDKNDILFALHKEGFKLLSSCFSILNNVGSPFERLKAMVRMYVQFALENTDYYELMFILKDPLSFLESGNDNPVWEEGLQTFNYFIQTIEQCKQDGYFKFTESKTAALIIWSTVHGLCLVTIRGHLDLILKDKKHFDNSEQALKETLNAYLLSLETIL